MRPSLPLLQRIDWITVVLITALVALGWLNIASATSGANPVDWLDWQSKQGKQLIWIAISAIIALALINIEGEFFIRTAILNYTFHLALLITVLIIGKKVGGARSWFGLGSFSIQPSELAKPATALMLAWLLSRSDGKLRDIKTLLQSIVIAGLPAALILLQPDAGTAMVFGGLIFALYREGLSGNVLVAAFLGLIVAVATILTGASNVNYPGWGMESGVAVLWIVLIGLAAITFFILGQWLVPRKRKRAQRNVIFSLTAAVIFSAGIHIGLENVLQQHQRERIHVLFGMDVSNPDADYNIRHAKAAIGSGGFTGKGYLQGPMTAYGFVPEQETDFIFCTVGEEWGFLGSAFTILLFTALLLRLLHLAERQRSNFTRIYAYATTSLLFMHFLINIGMVLGLAPVIGIPLPFFSAGGSSLLGFTMLLFILIRLDAERFTVLR